MRWIVTVRPADGPPLLVSDDERVVVAVLREITNRVRPGLRTDASIPSLGEPPGADA